MGDAEIRLLAEGEHTAAATVAATAMLGPLTEAAIERRALRFDPDTSHVALVDGQVVGRCRWFDTDVSTPGGSVPAAAISGVGVLPTHRRRGLLTGLMAAQLDQVRERELAIAVLVAAEYPIYGRYGYGPATWACKWDVDARATFLDPPTGHVELATPAEVRPVIECVHDARATRVPGALRRLPIVWDVIAGIDTRTGEPSDGTDRAAIWFDGEGQPAGAVRFRIVEHWDANRPRGTLDVELLVGTTPEAERELWRHLVSTDWIASVTCVPCALDEPLPLWLVDGRHAVATDVSDHVWARILDVPAALGARRSTVRDRLVVEVDDPLGYAGGTFSVELGPDGGEVAPTTQSADVQVAVRALGAAYLGGTPVAQLRSAGQVHEVTPGAAARLGALLSSPVAPWCPIGF